MLIFTPLNRLRPTIWAQLAREFGVPWRDVETMHWDLGRDLLTPSDQKPSSEPSMEKHELSKKSSNEAPDTSDVQTESSSKPRLRLVFDAPSQDFAEYRALHFESTSPPKVQPEAPARQVGINTATKRAQLFEPVRSSSADTPSSSLRATPAVNLTVEGQRQAQAAGDKLRARTTPSRHRKAVIAANNYTGHQNRWANYKSPNSTFLPNDSPNISQGFRGPSLTLEGRRQAQVAGDKLRCRTNPIRHARPSRGSISDHGISKNRWSSYGLRANRFDEQQDSLSTSREKAPSEATKEPESSGQPSLLELFEAELTKKISIDTNQEKGKVTVPEAVATTAAESEIPAQPRNSDNVTTLAQGGSSFEGPNPLLDGLKLINDHVQRLTVGDEDLPQEFPRAVGQGLRAAIGGISTFMRGVTSGLQEASNITRRAAEQTRETDLQVIDDTILGLRTVAGDVTALGQELLPKRFEARPSQAEAIVGSTVRSANAASDNVPEKNKTLSWENRATPLGDNNVADESQAPPPAGSQCSAARPGEITFSEEPSPPLMSDIPVTITRHSLPDSRRMHRNLGMNRVPRYHKPGPIHLPNHAHLAPSSTTAESQALATRSGYVDRLRRYNSTENVDEADLNQSTTVPAVAARFPTLAQFEGQNFTTKAPFPPLPSMSMEPLVPLRAISRSEAKKPAEGSHLLSQERTTEPEAGPASIMRNKGINTSLSKPGVSVKQNHAVPQIPTNPLQEPKMTDDNGNKPVQESHISTSGTNIRFDSYASQAPVAVQSSGAPPSDLHDNGEARPNHALQDYYMQLRLLEKQNKKMLLMARQEKDRITSERAKNDPVLASEKLMINQKQEQQAPSDIAQQPDPSPPNAPILGPSPGMAGHLMGGPAANQAATDMLMQGAINPGNLSDAQFASFHQQNSIQLYAQNLAKKQRQQSISNTGGTISDRGSPIMVSALDVGASGSDFYNGNNPSAMQMQGAPPSNVPNGRAGCNHALQDYQMQLMMLEQSKKQHSTKRQASVRLHHQLEEPEVLSLNEPDTGALDDIIDAAQKKRQSFKDQEGQAVTPNEVMMPGASPGNENVKLPPQASVPTQPSQDLEDHRNKINDLVDSPEEKLQPSLGSVFDDAREYLEKNPDPWYSPHDKYPWSAMNKSDSSGRLSSAARLAKPFDPLEAEPSAQPHLTEGIRRHATVAGTDSRYNARRRRPYSGAFDVSRVARNTFLHHPQDCQSTDSPHISPLQDSHRNNRFWIKDEETAWKPTMRAQGSRCSLGGQDDEWHWTNPTPREKDQASRPEYGNHGLRESWEHGPSETDRERHFDVEDRRSSPAPRETAQASNSSFDDHKEPGSLRVPQSKMSYKPRRLARASTISFKDWGERRKVYECVRSLQDLGFDNSEDDDGPDSRLMQYASAAGGDLVEAIDMIDEEQKAYKEREKDAVRFIDDI